MGLATESVQVAAFLTVPPTLTALQGWPIAFDGEPDSFQTNSPGNSQAAGIRDGISWSLQIQPGRVDIVGQGVPPTDLKASKLSDIGDIEVAVKIAAASLKSLTLSLKVGRVATVLQTFYETDNATDAVTQLRSLLPQLPIAEGARDLTYQVMVPVQSQVNPSRIINRLCRWQTVQVMILAIPASGITGGQLPTSNATFAAHQHIDVFAANMEDLTTDQVSEAIDEVAAMSLKITKGDRNGIL